MQITNRHSTIKPLTALLSLSLLLVISLAQADETIDLKVSFQNGHQCRVSANYEHSGNVLVLVDDESETANEVGKKVKSLPLTVMGQLAYFQRTSSPQQAIRYFEVAKAEIKLDQGFTQPSLADSNRLIIARLKPEDGEQVELASISDTLKQSELELIQNPADPLAIPNLFTKEKIKQGSKWEPEKHDLAKLLGVFEINETDVQLLLKKVDGNSAHVYLMGSVNADVDDVTTQMEISGVATIDLQSQAITSFKLGIQETRNPGQIAPGFEGKTRIDIRFTPNATSPKLSNEALAKHTENRKIRQRLKWTSEAGKFALTYDTRWKMIAAEDEGAVLRFVDKGDLITQCSVVQLPARPADQPLKLETYKTEVGKILQADKEARLVSANQFQTPSGLTALRVIVAGQESEVPINWFYYHVSAKDGRQVTFVFTLEEPLANRVAVIADQLINELEFQTVPKIVAQADATNKPETKSKNP